MGLEPPLTRDEICSKNRAALSKGAAHLSEAPMVVGLFDCDDVVTPFTEYLLQQVRKHVGADVPVPELSQIKTDLFDPATTPFSPEVFKVANTLSELPGFISDLPVDEKAREGIDALKKAGVEIVWLTAPHHASQTWGFDRFNWVRKNFGKDDVISTSAKYRVPGDFFVDDKVSNIRRWTAAHPDKLGLLYTQPWNEDPANNDLNRFTWADIPSLLEKFG